MGGDGGLPPLREKHKAKEIAYCGPAKTLVRFSLLDTGTTAASARRGERSCRSIDRSFSTSLCEVLRVADGRNSWRIRASRSCAANSDESEPFRTPEPFRTLARVSPTCAKSSPKCI